MVHLKKFATLAAYEAGKGNLDKPAFSFIEEGRKVVYDKFSSLPNGVYIKYTDGSYSFFDELVPGKTPVGVALKTDACSLCIHPSEGENKMWSENTSTEIPGVVTCYDTLSALDDYAGKANTEAVMNSGLAGSAFTFATEVVYADGSDGWLPSVGEMEQIRINVVDINVALELIGGAEFDFDNTYYWCSTQVGPWSAYYYKYGILGSDSKDDDDEMTVRSVTDF